MSEKICICILVFQKHLTTFGEAKHNLVGIELPESCGPSCTCTIRSTRVGDALNKSFKNLYKFFQPFRIATKQIPYGMLQVQFKQYIGSWVKNDAIYLYLLAGQCYDDISDNAMHIMRIFKTTRR